MAGGERCAGLLVRQGHGLERIVIEGIVGESGYIGVHTSLPCQHVTTLLIVLAIGVHESFEDRLTAVDQSGGIELRIHDVRFSGILLHHGG